MRAIPLLLAAAASSSCATQPPAPTRTAEAQAEFAKLTAERVPGAPITCLPAPIANRVSVAVADSETIRTGRFGTVTLPFETVIVAGNGAAVVRPGAASAVDASATARTVRNAARARRRAMGASPSPFREGVEAL